MGSGGFLQHGDALGGDCTSASRQPLRHCFVSYKTSTPELLPIP